MQSVHERRQGVLVGCLAETLGPRQPDPLVRVVQKPSQDGNAPLLELQGPAQPVVDIDALRRSRPKNRLHLRIRQVNIVAAVSQSAQKPHRRQHTCVYPLVGRPRNGIDVFGRGLQPLGKLRAKHLGCI